ncbi:hypothetical protein [Nitratireductor sp. ZSWI3]|uniref:hypothetical protein n=1 Tax=Nitratireductor sp. ZSWI3 TaxID=2966359 RepID=UPI00214FBE7A|nr:hypothetical protein [Nitratireductor sp. ZSWI3]MCR4265790.1 hypothetical protein [Nitratireductor sp. ZSWI3]
MRPGTWIFVVAAILVSGLLNLYWLQVPLDLSPIQPDRKIDTAAFGAPSLNHSATEESELLSSFSEALLRPLFHATRRPFEAPPETVESSPDAFELQGTISEAETFADVQEHPEQVASADIKLSGVSLSNGGKRALLSTSTSEDIRWLSEGDDIADWIIISITSDDVTLAKGEQRATLKLYPPSGSGTGTE